MVAYLQYNGWHFNKKMCIFAVSKMKRDHKQVQMTDKSRIDEILRNANITLDNNELWDYIYVYHMAKADLYGSSITDENHLAKYVKDVIDDEDGYDGIIFNRWYADMVKKGIPIDWGEMR